MFFVEHWSPRFWPGGTWNVCIASFTHLLQLCIFIWRQVYACPHVHHVRNRHHVQQVKGVAFLVQIVHSPANSGFGVLQEHPPPVSGSLKTPNPTMRVRLTSLSSTGSSRCLRAVAPSVLSTFRRGRCTSCWGGTSVGVTSPALCSSVWGASKVSTSISVRFVRNKVQSVKTMRQTRGRKGKSGKGVACVSGDLGYSGRGMERESSG